METMWLQCGKTADKKKSNKILKDTSNNPFRNIRCVCFRWVKKKVWESKRMGGIDSDEMKYKNMLRIEILY